MTRRRSSVYVSVSVDLDDVFADLSSEDLKAELRSRGVATEADRPSDIEALEAAYDAVRRRDLSEAELILERICRPKWRSLVEAETALAAARKPATGAPA